MKNLPFRPVVGVISSPSMRVAVQWPSQDGWSWLRTRSSCFSPGLKLMKFIEMYIFFDTIWIHVFILKLSQLCIVMLLTRGLVQTVTLLKCEDHGFILTRGGGWPIPTPLFQHCQNLSTKAIQVCMKVVSGDQTPPNFCSQ